VLGAADGGVARRQRGNRVEPAIRHLDLPEGWVQKAIADIASRDPRAIQSGPFGSNLRHSEFSDVGMLAIGIDNVLEGSFSEGKQHRIKAAKYLQLAKYAARPLDVLVTVMATVGRCCVVPADIDRSSRSTSTGSR
jgi:type I restriction enzyme S subunit